MEIHILYTQRDGFQECGIPKGQEWLDNESEDMRAKRLGWEPFYAPCSGRQTYESTTIWTTQDSAYPMTAQLDLGASWMEIWFPTRADFVHYWHQFQFAAARTAHHIDEIHEMAQKIFLAQHGHAGEEYCHECNPLQSAADLAKVQMTR